MGRVLALDDADPFGEVESLGMDTSEVRSESANVNT